MWALFNLVKCFGPEQVVVEDDTVVQVVKALTSVVQVDSIAVSVFADISIDFNKSKQQSDDETSKLV